MFPFVLISIVVAGFVGLVIYANYREKKRREGLRQLASTLGLEYSEFLVGDDAVRFQRFPLSQLGRSQKATSAIIAESDDRRLVLFDYQYVTGTGKQRKTRHLAALLCRSSLLALPVMSLEPDSWSSKIATFFGGQDIRFDDSPFFSDRYRVRGASEEAVRSFLTLDRRAKIMELPHELMEAAGDSFIIYRRYKQLTAEAVHDLLKEGLAMSEALL